MTTQDALINRDSVVRIKVAPPVLLPSALLPFVLVRSLAHQPPCRFSATVRYSGSRRTISTAADLSHCINSSIRRFSGDSILPRAAAATLHAVLAVVTVSTSCTRGTILRVLSTGRSVYMFKTTRRRQVLWDGQCVSIGDCMHAPH